MAKNDAKWKMKTSSGNLLPYNTWNGELSGAIDLNAPGLANDSDHHVKTFVAGDDRVAAENPVLTSLHALYSYVSITEFAIA